MFTHFNASAEGADEEKAPSYTVYLGESNLQTEPTVLYRENFAEGWDDVVNLADTVYKMNPTNYVKAVLTKDWVATENSTAGLGGTTYFDSGRIKVPKGTNITIDLNGHSINRNLTEGIGNGQVILVEGNLTVTDGATGGKITGGYNRPTSGPAYGGGIYVNGGTLKLKGGSIEGNRVNLTTFYGIGVSVHNGGQFDMYGGTIANNENTAANANAGYGGGVGVYSSGTFNMYGGTIERNSATYGGGVASYTISTAANINIESGKISENTATSGGGVYVSYRANVTLKGGEISSNSASQYGGGVCLWTNQGATQGLSISLAISGGSIVNNTVSSLNGTVYGGGIAAYTTALQATLGVKMTDGLIANNKAIANCENSSSTYQAQGGGVFVKNATFTLENGEISGNRAGSFKQGDTAGNLNDLCDGTKTYGGGVHIEKSSESAWKDAPCAFNMNGGSIKNNRAYAGGGVNLQGEFAFNGGAVEGNTAQYSGGLYLNTNAKLMLSGAPKLEGNKSTVGDGNSPSNLQISADDTDKVMLAGALEEGALIHLAVDEALAESGMPVMQDYGVHNREFISVDGREPENEVDPQNGVWAYANPYEYFVSDNAYIKDGSAQRLNAQHLIVLANGNLALARNELKYTVKYSNNSTKDFTFGTSAGEIPAMNYTASAYGDEIHPVSVSANGSESPVGSDAHVYKLAVKPDIGGDAEAMFSVVVKAKVLTAEEITVTLPNTTYTYDGSPKRPAPTSVKYGSISFSYGENYYLDYRNNIEAGKNTAIVVISFTGNYTGEVLVYFSINSSTATTTQVAWQYKNGESWFTLTEQTYGTAFIYDGTDQRGNFRALLTYNDGTAHTQTVYAQGVNTNGDGLQNVGMWLEFNGSAQNEFENAGTYTVRIEGYSNYVLAVSSVSGIKMNAQPLNINVSDFAGYEDELGTRLWRLKIGTDGEAMYSYLLDEVTYTLDGEDVPGTEKDAYARYRGKELSLVLNPAYTLKDGSSLQEWLDKATVTYTHEGEKIGINGKLNKVTTTVTIEFGSNYAVDGGSSITFYKEWYIVTISNNLRDATTTEEVVGGTLDGWTFGAFADELKIHAFRPEHGDTVIYSYYMAGELVQRFAIRYSDTTYGATKQFFEVEVVGGQLVASNVAINDSNYLYTVNFNLRAGSYTLEVTIPENEPESDEHHHWWDGDSSAIDYGVTYYKLTYTFTLEIGNYALVNEAGELNQGITYSFPQRSVEYNGKENNIAEPVIKLNGLTLIRDLDYKLYSDRVEVGWASLVIEGINSLYGTFEYNGEEGEEGAFEIVKGTNGWINVPSIISWTYFGFKKEINLIRATAYFGEAVFTIARDEAGTDPISGLIGFTVDENGCVSDEVEKALKALKAGNYYLVGLVEETSNYRILDPNPIPFVVLATTNSWETTPSVKAWTEGEFESFEKNILVKPAFGDAHIVIKGEDGKTYYDNFKDINNLKDAKAGTYRLIASVAGSEDYSALDDYTVIFQIFERPGLPWWAILLIVIGSLGLAALVIFILWKKGVFQIVTEKFVVAIRTRASVEATMASIRAAKMMEEGRQSIEDAKRRERIEKMRLKEEAQQELTPEERAAQLEAKAQADEEKAEKLRARSEENRAQAAKMRSEDGTEKEEPSAKKKSTKQNPETPTEE